MDPRHALALETLRELADAVTQAPDNTPSPVTAPRTPSRKRRYIDRQQARGLVKVTLWIPAAHKAALTLLADRACNNPDLEPAYLRNTRTGRLTKP